MRRAAVLSIVTWLAATLVAFPVAAQNPTPSDRSKAKSATKTVRGCTSKSRAAEIAARIASTTKTNQRVAYGAPIEVTWQLPSVGRATLSYLVGAMPDTVRLDGNYQVDADGTLQSGPGFAALPGKSRAPYGFTFGEDRTRVIIPIHDADVPRAGALRIKPYLAGPLTIDWAVVVVDPSCAASAAGRIAERPLGSLGPFDVAAGAPEIVVQDFVAPDPLLEVAAPDGSQKLSEVEVSSDGRYRLEIFPRRYRVFDRNSGAKIVDRSGVKPRFSPGGRFVVASVGDAGQTYPTNLETIDLVAGKVVARVTGPIVGWSNGDALLLDATRAYQSVWLFNTLVDPVMSAENTVASWPYFSPGCGTCDAWIGSNLRIDWDRFSVLRADGGSVRAMGLINVATGKKTETTSFGDEEAWPLEAKLRHVYGRPDVAVAAGWTSDASLLLTHVGRGYNGYTDDDDSLTPSEAGRKSALDYLAPRRLALADGQVLRSEDLKPAGITRGAPSPARRRSTRGLPLEEASVGDELGRFGLRLTAAEPIAELSIPVEDRPGGHDPLVRNWPETLKAEVLATNPSLQTWFEATDWPDIVVAAWRFEVGGIQYLLLQHGEPAMTANGAHHLRFDLLTLNGPAKGALRTLEGIGGLFSQFVGRDHTVARVSVLDGKRLVVAVPGSGKAEIVSMDGSFATKTFEIQEPTVLCGFYEAGARRLLVQGNCDGQLFVFEPHRQSKPLLAGRVIDNELILYTPEGFYASTYEGAHFVHVGFPGLPGVQSFEQFAKVLNRPDVIEAIIAGQPLTLAAPTITPPPQIEAVLRAGSGGEILAKAKSDVGLAAVELYQDGRLIDRRTATGHAAEVLFQADVPAHIRGFTLVATDVKGFKSRALSLAAPVAQRPRTNTLHVVAVGVDDYDQLAKLKGARFDAETLVAALRNNASYYQDVRATVRLDREVTPEVVMGDLKAAVDAAGPDDTILVFFAGHGGRTDDGRYFMAAPTTDLGRLPETAIGWQKAAELLGTAKGRVIAVLDACHSGQTGLAPVDNDGAVASLAMATRAPMVVLAASKGRQESEEMPDTAGGVFTQTLAQVIGVRRKIADVDGDGVLAISELYRSLHQAVEATTGGRQTPWLVRRNIVGDAPLF